jgi:hypothetical protein
MDLKETECEHLSGSEVVGCCDHSNECLGSLEDREFD